MLECLEMANCFEKLDTIAKDFDNVNKVDTNIFLLLLFW